MSKRNFFSVAVESPTVKLKSETEAVYFCASNRRTPVRYFGIGANLCWLFRVSLNLKHTELVDILFFREKFYKPLILNYTFQSATYNRRYGFVSIFFAQNLNWDFVWNILVQFCSVLFAQQLNKKEIYSF